MNFVLFPSQNYTISTFANFTILLKTESAFTVRQKIASSILWVGVSKYIAP